MQRTIQSCFLSTLAAAVGLLTVLIIGRVLWAVGSGIIGIILGAFVAGVVATLMKRGGRIVSTFAACFGAGVASFLAIATAEQLPPGSTEWMVKGGLYGASVGLPLAFVLGTAGLVRSRSRAESHAVVPPKDAGNE